MFMTDARAVELLSKTAQHIEEGVQDDLDAGDFRGAMETLDTIRDAARWVQGDLINDAKSIYGITPAYKLAAKAMGTHLNWAVTLSRVADIFPPETRRADVPWQLYRAASMYPDPYAALEDALENGKTANQLRTASKGGGVDSIGTPQGTPVDQN
jgi:hypothetical protein